MKKVLSFFLTVALLACFGLSTAAAKSAQPNATTLRLFAPTPDPDRDTLAVTDVSYTLNYKQSALPLPMVQKPVLVLADGTIKIETDFTAIEYSLTSAAGPWSDAVTNPDPIPYGSGTANIYWRVKYNGEWYATKDGKAQKVTMNYPPCEASLYPTDGDGNIYEVVRVAGNCWTKTNLKAKKYAVDVKDYSAGDSVRNVIIYSADGNSDTASNKDKYGCLYSWFSAVGLAEGSTESPRTNEWGNVEGVCPAGWNLPSAADFRAMLGIEANRLRSYNNWIANPGRNTTGMSMQPGGYYDSGSDNCVDIGSIAYFWTCEQVNIGSPMVRCFMADCFCDIIREIELAKTSALSVRCVKEMVKERPEFQYLDLYTYETNIFAYSSFVSLGSDMDHYKFCIATNAGMTEGLQCYDDVPTSYYLFTGLTPGTTYYVQVIGFNAIDSDTSTVESIRVNPVVPVVTTGTISDTTYYSANVINSNITFDGGESVTARGVCWSTSPNPTLSDSHTSDGTGTGSFSSSLTGLAANTTYYVRAYATNSVGTAYGDNVAFTSYAVITFMPEGATGGPAGSSSYVPGVPATLAPATHDGNWEFTGWNTKADGTGTNYTSSMTPSGIDTLYAQWRTWCTGTPRMWETGTGRVESIEDYNNNVYRVIQIGDQCWMKENLKATHYADGTQPSAISGAYFYTPGNSGTNVATYGYLYNWKAAMKGGVSSSANPSDVQGICPNGWHVPSDAELTQLTDYVKNVGEYKCQAILGNIAQALASTGKWTYDASGCVVGNDPSLNNKTGFSALSAGYYNNSASTSVDFNISANFISSTQHNDDNAYYRYLYYTHSTITAGYFAKAAGYSVRCVRGEITLNVTSDRTDTISRCGSMDTTVTYTATLSGAMASTYSWKVNGVDSSSVTGSTLTVRYTTAATNKVVCTAAGVSDTAVTVTRVNTVPTLGLCEDCGTRSIEVKTKTNVASIVWRNSSSDSVSNSMTALVQSASIPAGVYTATGKSSAGCTVSRTATLGNAVVHPCTVLHKRGNEQGSTATTIDSVKDHQDNWYKVVQIGSQCWLAENMRATTEPDSPTSIVQNPASGTSTSVPRAYQYNNSTTYSDKYGLLYNFPGAMNINDGRTSFTYPHRGVCPDGWHVPQESEWDTLVVAAGCTSAYDGGTGLGKLTGGCDWTSNSKATAPGNYSYSERNSSGFTALPAGGYGGSFGKAGDKAYFLSATLSSSNLDTYRSFGYDNESAHRDFSSRGNGMSVRCVRDVTGLTLGAVTKTDSTATTLNISTPYTATKPVIAAKVCAYTDSACTIPAGNCDTNATFASSPITGTITGLTSGAQYYVKVTATTAGGSESAVGGPFGTKYVTLNISSDRTDTIFRCGSLDTTVTYTATVIGDTPANYAWKVNGSDSSSVTGSTLTVHYTGAATNKVVCTAAGVSDTAVTVTRVGIVPTLGLCEDCGTRTIEVKTKTNVASIVWRNSSSDSVSNSMTALVQSASIPAGVYAATGKSSDGCTVSRTATLGNAVVHPCTVLHKRGNEQGSTATTIDSVKDHQDNWYKVVQIGSQCWLAENMRATTEPDSPTSIVQNPASGTSTSVPRAYQYNNSTTYSDKYGLLYNFPGAMNINDGRTSFTYPHRGVCPDGWHVPQESEWDTLVVAAGCTSAYDGGTGLGKLTGGCDWTSSSKETAPGNYSYSERNSSGFTALPAGGYGGSFGKAGDRAYFLSATLSSSNLDTYRSFGYGNQSAHRDFSSRGNGMSVRCVRDVTGLTLGAVTKTDSTATTLNISTPYTATKPVIAAKVCAYTDSACTIPAGNCDTNVTFASSPITGTITGLTANTQYYVKVTATTAGGSESAVGGPFATANPITDTITFVANGGTGTMAKQAVPRDMATALNTITFTHSNWAFTGWNDACDGNGTNYADGANITTNGNVTLYANWHTWCTGTARGNEQGTSRIDSVKDHQDNWYKVVQIGSQCWLAENMRATTEPDSPTSIVQNPASGTSTSVPRAYQYSNSTTYSDKYGLLYNFPGAMNINDGRTSFTYPHRGICPDGWHVPQESEWDTLVVAAGCTSAYDGGTGLGKLTGGCDWTSSSKATAPGNYSYSERNSSGFTALPAGGYGGSFGKAGDRAYFLSATLSSSNLDTYRSFGYGNASAHRDFSSRGNGMSVRCVRDVTGLILDAVTKTDSSITTLNTSTPYTATQPVIAAKVCAYTDSACTILAGICDTDVTYSTSHITGTITGLTPATQYYVKVTATTASGSESAVGGPFGTAEGITDTITFVANGGTGTMTKQVVKRGVATPLSTLGYSHTGNWAFTGWNDACDGNGTTYDDGANITTNGNVKLYANWHTWCTGTAYINESGTARIDSVKDHQDNWYKVVQIGTQCWLAENMRCSTSPNGHLTAGGSSTSTLLAYYYDYSTATQFTLRERGYLYNWAGALDTNATSNFSCQIAPRGICPAGWHLPTDLEWKILEKGYLTETDGTTPIKDSTLNSDGEKNRGKGNGKFTGGCDWNGSSSSGTFPNNYSYADRNISGFSALPAGLYFIDESIFYFAGAYASFWSATSDGGIKAWDRTIYRGYESVERSNTSKKYGFSVRCVRDNSGLTLGAVTKTDSTATTLSISTPYTATQAVIAATVCAFTDATCITPAGTCDTNVSYASSPITGTITGLTPGTYYVKVTATTAGGSKSAVGGPFRTVYMITDTITFVANGGTGTMTKQVVMRGVATPLSTLGYSHTGNWAFTEWNDACDGDGNTYTDGANITTNGNVKLYANWHTWCTGTAGSNESGTSRIDSVKDHQNNWYKVVEIGTGANKQCWMKENMRATTSPRQGQAMSSGLTMNLTVGSSTDYGQPYYYDYSTTSGSYPQVVTDLRERGYLYNWNAAIDTVTSSYFNQSFTGHRGICPSGWHIPTDGEWTSMDSLAGVGENSGTGLGKLTGGCTWSGSGSTTSPNSYSFAERNFTGFSGGAVGYYDGSFRNAGNNVSFWSATTGSDNGAWNRDFINSYQYMVRSNCFKYDGFSVRCVRDVVTLTVTSNRTDTISRCGSMDTTVTYTATIEGATASSYSWKVNGRDSTAVTGNTLTVRYTAAATNNVVCTAAGVSDTAVTVTQISKLLTLGLCETCIEGTITMKTGNCTSVTWVNNADPTKTGTVSSVSEGSVVLSVSSSAPAGVYTFTGTNSDGCTVSRTATLGNAVPHPCTVAFQRSNEAGSTATSVDSVKDHQNNWYKVVQIGSQCWLAENMRCSTSPKGNLTAGTERSDYIAYYFDYSSATQLSLRERGYLYNWPGALDTTGTEEITASFTCRRGICPEGWHLPTDEEWKTLEAGYLTEEDGTTPITAATLNSEDWRGKGAGKFTGGCDWKDTSETTAPGNYSYADRNMTGFFALPAGYWWGHFNFAYDYAFFWSATSKDVGIAYFRELNYGVGKMRRDWWPKNAGKSVRCVRDVTGLTLGAVTGTDSTGSTLSISTPYTTTQAVTAATVCAYTDAACTTLAGTCATGVSYESSPITGTITGLTPGASYYVKVTASTAGGTESAVGGPFRTKNVKLTISSNPSSASVSLCGQPSTTVTYTATLTGSTVSSYNWSVTGGTGSSTTNMITVTATDACTINVSCTAEGVSASKSTIVTSGGTVPKLALCETCSEGTITVKLSENASSIVWRNSSNDSVSNSMTGLVQSTTIPAGVYTATAKSSDGCTVSRTAPLGKATVHPCTVAAKNSNEAGSTTTTIDSVKDHQDNWYRVVQIGSQCWLAENMRATTEPASSTTIVENPALLWGSTSSPRAYHYSNSTTYSDKFGLIYNFAAAMNINDERETFTYPHRGICPQGWHIPQTSEWDTLAIAAGCTAAYNTGTGVGKLTSGCDWLTSTQTTAPGNYSYSERNSSGFSALPGGYFAAYEGFIYVNARTDFWSSTPYGSSAACSRMLHYNDQFVTGGTSGHGARDNGLYVRCVRDNTGLTLGAVTKTDSNTNTLNISTPYTATQAVTAATVCAYTDSTCTTSAVTCATGVSYESSLITGTITGLTPGAQYYVKVTATTAGGTESAVGGPFKTKDVTMNITSNRTDTIFRCGSIDTTVTYTATLEGATASSYSWKVNGVDSSSVTGNTLTVRYTTAATNKVVCTAAGVSDEVVTVTRVGTAATLGLCEDCNAGSITMKTGNCTSLAWVNNADPSKSGTVSSVSAGSVVLSKSSSAPAGVYTFTGTNSDGCTVSRSATLGDVVTHPCTVAFQRSNEAGSTATTIDSVKDHQNNWYKVVQIGSQCWLAENMRATTEPGSSTSITQFVATVTSYDEPIAYRYNNKVANANKFGLMYNFPAVMNINDERTSFVYPHRGICPEGWHVPQRSEWETMAIAVGYTYTGKLASGCDWFTSSDTTAPGNYTYSERNSSGFSALSGGSWRGSFMDAGYYAFFWTSTPQNALHACDVRLSNGGGLGFCSGDYRYYGCYVRCVRNITDLELGAVTKTDSTATTLNISVAYTATQTVTAATVCAYTDAACTTPAGTCGTNVTYVSSPITGTITGLTPGTPYYVKVTATTAGGSESEEGGPFRTIEDGQPCPATLTDVDGNVYNTVQMENRCWMKENLKTTRYADGTTISLGSEASTTTAYRYYPNNDSLNVSTYGYLYNWKAVMRNSSSSNSNPSGVQGICPNGWHVPSDAEWIQLTNYVSSQSLYVCGSTSTNIAKALASNTGWKSGGYTCAVGNNPSTNNATGFSAVPAGGYYGSYDGFGNNASFWSSTERYNYYHTYYRSLNNGSADVYSGCHGKMHGFSVRCLKDVGPTVSLPTVSTTAVSGIAETTATSGGNVTADGGAMVTARGVCWSTSQNPTIADSHTTDGNGTGSYTSSLTGLIAGTTYYVRAYATNSEGTGYGEQLSFTTPVDGQPCPGAATLTDVDGNVYNTVQIGSQCWMKENLRTTKYADGTSISLGSSTSTTTAYRYYPNNSNGNVATYGYLYNWKAVMGNSSSSSSNPSGVQGICPNGWHVPSDAEWTQLTDYVSSQSEYVCESTSTNIAKALASTTGWYSYSVTCAVGNNPSTNNATGFSSLPAGGYLGSYGYFSSNAVFWSATQYDSSSAYYRYLVYSLASVSSYGTYKDYGFSVRCLKDESPTVSLPSVSTTAVSGITLTAATSGGNVTADGGATVTARGVCWSTSQNPTIADSHTTDGNGTGSYTSSLTGLIAGTTYYVRAYATNSEGTGYGEQVSFTTPADGQPCPGAATLTDVDGNVYNTVQIGNQCWMKENLRTTHYANGTSISLGSSTSTTTAYRYYPNNDASNVPTYGYLYNWKSVMRNSSSSDSNPSGVQGICPNGWHLPSNAEWTQLTDYVSSQSEYVCESTSTNIAKALASTTGWNSNTNTCAVGNNPSTNNATGFSAVPAGNYYGSYYNFGNNASFWSSTEYLSNYAYNRTLYYNYAEVDSYYDNKTIGFSVRCLRD